MESQKQIILGQGLLTRLPEGGSKWQLIITFWLLNRADQSVTIPTSYQSLLPADPQCLASQLNSCKTTFTESIQSHSIKHCEFQGALALEVMQSLEFIQNILPVVAWLCVFWASADTVYVFRIYTPLQLTRLSLACD